jgi:hypothetical protein
MNKHTTIYIHKITVDGCQYRISFNTDCHIYISCPTHDADFIFNVVDYKIDWECSKFSDGSFFGDLIPQEVKDHTHCVLLCMKHGLDPKTHLEKVMMIWDKDIEKYFPLL